eukprot:IDg10493t1
MALWQLARANVTLHVEKHATPPPTLPPLRASTLATLIASLADDYQRGLQPIWVIELPAIERAAQIHYPHCPQAPPSNRKSRANEKANASDTNLGQNNTGRAIHTKTQLGAAPSKRINDLPINQTTHIDRKHSLYSRLYRGGENHAAAASSMTTFANNLPRPRLHSYKSLALK